MVGYYVIKKEPESIYKVVYYSLSKANADSICEDIIVRILESFVGEQCNPQFYRKSLGGSWGKIPANLNYWIVANAGKYTLYHRKYYGLIYHSWEVNKIVSVFVANDPIRKLTYVESPIVYHTLPQELIEEIGLIDIDENDIISDVQQNKKSSIL